MLHSSEYDEELNVVNKQGSGSQAKPLANQPQEDFEKHSSMEQISTPRSAPTVTPTTIVSKRTTSSSLSTKEDEQSKLTPPPVSKGSSVSTLTPPVDESQAKKANDSPEVDDSANCFTSPSGAVYFKLTLSIWAYSPALM